MNSERPAPASGAQRGNVIELELNELRQLFNSLDPSPFHEKDLDDDAEEFMVSWAQEFHLRAPLSLVIHLRTPPPGGAGGDAPRIAEQAIHHYFAYRADLTRREFRHLLRQGRLSLLIGVVFLVGCFAVGEVLTRALGAGPFTQIVRECIFIGGWVAMWRPMEIFLYDWWPVRRRKVMFEKMSRMPVDVRVRQP